MKQLIGALTVLVVALSAPCLSRAQYVTNDSANGVVYSFYEVSNAPFAEGPPDFLRAEIDSGSISELDIYFTRKAGGLPLPIQVGSHLKIYGDKVFGIDSCAAEVRFYRLASDGQIQHVSRAFFASAGVTTISIDTEYTYLSFQHTSPDTVKGAIGSKAFGIDAVTLFEDFRGLAVQQINYAHAPGLTTNFPNPFMASRPTTLDIHLARSGSAQLVVMDAVGREVSRTNLGYLNAGDYQPTFRTASAGIYFARVLLDGVPYGRMLKMTSIR